MKKTIGVISLILILIASAFAATPVFAKNLNLPKGADLVLYYTGGEAVINLPTDPALRINYPSTATMMKLRLMHFEMPNAGIEFSSMLIYLYMPVTTGADPSWCLYAHITTSHQDEAYAKNLWSGIPFVEFPGPHYLPYLVTTDNVKYVSDSVFQVERHGNNIYANLGTPQPVQRPYGLDFNIPAFSIELNKYGGSFHSSTSSVLTGYYGSSDYTAAQDIHGFNANGAFISAWNTNGIPVSIPVSDGKVIMQGILTFYPPAA